jgi:spermidine synthase
MIHFEELAYHETTLGELTLRCRTEPRADNKLIYEVKLNEEFLMSSLFTASEEALATLALDALDGDPLDVVVGGLGLGYTAATALKSSRVGRVTVVDILAEIIGWHRQGLVPLGKTLCDDGRCELVHASFFDFPARGPELLGPERAGHQVDAVLLDIDHSPTHWLHGSNAGFYGEQGLKMLRQHVRPGGIFALWSNDPESTPFMALLGECFESAEAHRVAFDNPYTGGESACTVYVCRC